LDCVNVKNKFKKINKNIILIYFQVKNILKTTNTTISLLVNPGAILLNLFFHAIEGLG